MCRSVPMEGASESYSLPLQTPQKLQYGTTRREWVGHHQLQENSYLLTLGKVGIYPALGCRHSALLIYNPIHINVVHPQDWTAQCASFLSLAWKHDLPKFADPSIFYLRMNSLDGFLISSKAWSIHCTPLTQIFSTWTQDSKECYKHVALHKHMCTSPTASGKPGPPSDIIKKNLARKTHRVIVYDRQGVGFWQQSQGHKEFNSW